MGGRGTCGAAVCAGVGVFMGRGCVRGVGGGRGVRVYAFGVRAETEEMGRVTARPRTTQCVCVCVCGGGGGLEAGEGSSVWCAVCRVCGRVANQLGGCVCVWGPDVCVRGVQAGCACGYACGV